MLINDWTCALSKAVLLQGRLYLSQNYLCFHSKIFGTDTKEVIKLSDIQAIKKRNKFVIGIEVFMKNGVDRYLFCSFLTRSRTYKVIADAWTKKTDSLTVPTGSQSLASSSSTSGLKDTDGSDIDGNNSNNNNNSSSSSDANNDGGSSSDSEMGDIDSMFTGHCNQDRDGFLTAPPGTETIPQMVIPFTPVQFFYLFLSDKSEEFERQLKCLTPRLSLEVDPWKVSSEHNGMMVREMRSTVSLVELKAPVGPEKSRMVETQRCILTKDSLILQIRSFSLDIPYNDCFHTESEWVFTKVSPTASSLVGKGCTVWVKRSIIKSLIDSTTIKQMRGQATMYVDQVKKWGEDKKELLDRIERYVIRSGGKRRKQGGSAASSSSSSSGQGKKTSGDGAVSSGRSDGDVGKTTSVTMVGTVSSQHAGVAATGGGGGRNHILVVVLMCLILFYLVSKVVALEKKLDKVNSIMMAAAAAQNGRHEL